MLTFRNISVFRNGLSSAAIRAAAIVLASLTTALAQAAPTYFAAIAVSPFSSSDPNIHWGTASWYKSQTAANQSALSTCRAQGGHACVIAAQGSGTHLALAIYGPKNAWGIGFGDTSDMAIANALATCWQKTGGDPTNCAVPPKAVATSKD